MKRRDFIKGTLGTGLVTAGSCVFRIPLISSAQATPINEPTVLTIFQRGGCDGLNTVVPHGDPNYENLRPTIHIPKPDSLNPFPALDLDGFFGLHPSMASLLPIYNEQNMAVLPTVHYPSAFRSHFSSQHYIESGVSPANMGNANPKNLDGWLNRHLQVAGQSTLPLQAVGFGSQLAQALRGNIPVQSFSFINSFNLGNNVNAEQGLINGVLPLYEELPSPQSSYRELVHNYGKTLFSNLSAVDDIDTSSYIPANGAIYPNGSYGRRLKEIAQLIKSPNVSLQAVNINQGGYDTHSSQGAGEPDGRLSSQLKEFSDGIAALITDLGEKMDDVVILTMTEFGRTSKENGSAGTDHGNASSWFAFGNKINGGIYGEWPGLAEENLYQERYLASTIDYRNIFGEVLFNHLGHSENDITTLLPGHTYNSLGLF